MSREAELERYVKRLKAEKSQLAQRFSDKRDEWKWRANGLEAALTFILDQPLTEVQAREVANRALIEYGRERTRANNPKRAA